VLSHMHQFKKQPEPEVPDKRIAQEKVIYFLA
jgi:hypothetical protein